MKHNADKKRTKWHFSPGDKVLLKLQPYRQNFVRGTAPHKLAARFYGPYAILAKIQKDANKLDLPLRARVHDIFHVSQLKKYTSNSLITQSDMPTF